MTTTTQKIIFKQTEDGTLDRDTLLKLENGIYTGVNFDDEQVIVARQHGCGFTVKVLQNSTKGKYWLCHDYDENGYLEYEYFEYNDSEDDEKPDDDE